MAILANITTSFGEKRECYIRLHDFEMSKQGAPAMAYFRAYLSQADYEAGALPVQEYTIAFEEDVNAPSREQAYEALKAAPDPYWQPDGGTEVLSAHAALTAEPDPDAPVEETAVDPLAEIAARPQLIVDGVDV